MKRNVLILSTIEVKGLPNLKESMEKKYNVKIFHSFFKENKILDMPESVDGLIFAGNIDSWQIKEIKKTLFETIYCNRLDTHINQHSIELEIMLTFSTVKSAFDDIIKKLFNECVAS